MAKRKGKGRGKGKGKGKGQYPIVLGKRGKKAHKASRAGARAGPPVSVSDPLAKSD